MVEWLAVWGVYTVAGFVFTEVLAPLAKSALEDYVKDFFKDSIKDFTGLFQKDTLQTVLGKALKEFLQLVQQELEDAEVSEAQLKQYIKPLNQFINNKSVKEILGSAFQYDCKAVDPKRLSKIWYQLDLLSLPEEFDWEQVGKRYVKKVKALINESPELRAILDSQNIEAIKDNTKELAGIVPEFDLRRYQEGLRERYGNLNLDSLDTSVYDYREKLKVWQVFTAQNVRECLEFLPQVYEIPKEHQKRLRESNELEGDINPEEWERYKQVYYQQPIRSVLDVVNDMQSDRLPPQPPLLRGEQDALDSATVPPLTRGVRGVNSFRYIVILGDPGSGKSTLLQYIALNWARTPLNNVISQRIPLLIELRSYKRDRNAGQCKDFLEFFHKGSVICRLNQHQLQATQLLNQLKALTKYDLHYYYDPQRDEREAKLVRGIRTKAVAAVATTWKDDPETLPWLKQRVKTDDDRYVRGAAIEALVRGWKDDSETITLLKYPHPAGSHRYDDGYVRGIAMAALIDGWRDDSETLLWLKQGAQEGDDWHERIVAMYGLARGWKNDPDTLPILKTRAVSDDHEYVRCAAVQKLAKGWKDEPWMFEFLCDRAVNDPFERKEDREDNPRQLALEIIIKQYPDHSQTLPLLQDRAENDPDEKVRELAKKKLAELEK